jgi:hypothetical protein
MSGRRLLLPKEWRDINIAIRRKLADEDYPRLLEKDRIPRMLDDLFSEYFVMMPKLNDVLLKVQSIKTLDDHNAAIAIGHLEEELQQFLDDTDQLLNCPNAVEILQPAHLSAPRRPRRHEVCCPHFPFNPHRLQYPPAGGFRIVTYGIEWYICSVLHPAIRAKYNGNKFTKLKIRDATYYSREICQTFAAMEDDLSDDPDAIIPFFQVVMMSTMTCDLELRVWLWCRLRHFEQSGHQIFNAMKRHLAVLWNIPEEFVNSSPSHMARDLTCDNIVAAMKVLGLDE